MSALDDLVAHDVFTTTITVAEISYGLRLLPTGRRRSQLAVAAERLFDQVLDMRILYFDYAAADAYGSICASREAIGKPISRSAAMIAAICQANDAQLWTRNSIDFEHLQLPISNPWLAGDS